MEEKLDKLIALTELQNKAWEKCLELLLSVAESLTAEQRHKQILLEKHPAPQPTPSAIAQSANVYNDQYRYGVEMEDQEDSYTDAHQQQNQQPPQEPQQPFRETPPEVPVTSKAEMMEQAEKRTTTPEV